MSPSGIRAIALAAALCGAPTHLNAADAAAPDNTNWLSYNHNVNGQRYVPLDRDVLLGRDPRPTADQLAQRPHVLRLPSPGKDISRNHLEVRLLGWRVVAIDLGSVNGTTVRPPEGPAERLPPGGTRLIEPGAEVTLAGVVSFIYEAAA